ncbi:hypothetical protein PENDEC_c020G00432 [Penicillium decumbens]|uniref:Uncharacterized protein n=1 Tax=Penicillium decumbens TaxID=69771 RepID=A0A1V6P738_PENDC|nr:hypothetical protein PENDEC_c020G00432 [Penicillium decumbens]
MADLPRRRRSSISEQIQRVFNVDRSDKKHQNTQTEVGLSAAIAQLKNGHDESKATISHERQNETRPSSFFYTRSSGLLSTITPHPTPPFQPVMSLDPMPLQRASEAKPSHEVICTSPTWDNSRKERRATKRLEAERKELGQRLLRLEEDQSRLDHGAFDRKSRRLTKKQPLDSASRSSSADREGRSSSAFSGFFSRSRRSFQSRANSKDSESRRQSSDIPPTLPLVLPERFGAAVSRELATKHGTTLVPSHQTVHTLHTLHTTSKSDDLRENWRMAEAWQRNNETRELTPTRSAVYRPGVSEGGQLIPQNASPKDTSQPYAQATELSADLARETFTATLRHARKPVDNWFIPTAQGNIMMRPAMPSGARAQIESSLQAPDATSTRVTTARQLHNLVPPKTTQGPHKPFQASISMPGIPQSKHHKKSRATSHSQTNPTSFKSSPLSLSPFTNDDSGRKENNRMPRATDMQNKGQSIIPAPLRIQVPQHDKSKGRSQQPMSATPAGIVQSRPKDTIRSGHRQSFQGQPPLYGNGDCQQHWCPQPATTSMDTTPTQATEEAKPFHNDGPPLPIKHAGRTASLTNNPSDRLDNEGQRETNITTDAPAHSSSEPSGSNLYTAEEAPENGSVLGCLNPQVRSRASSQSSSQASYDTADEEVLGISKAQNHANANTQPSETSSLTPTREGSAANGRLSNDTTSLARDGSLSKLRKRPKQKTKAPLPGQLIAKLFVICCRCKYWHDMPSEVYAKLACPERLPSESLMSRTFSRRNSTGRKISLGNSLLSSDPSDTQRVLTTEQKEPTKEMQSSRKTQAAAGMPLTPPSCCWCGHNMRKTCCQGWTTLVQMSERHH